MNYSKKDVVPVISAHAYERAAERLGMHRAAFTAWVEATFMDWTPISPPYLWDRGLKCNATGGDTLYMCPWTPLKGVAMAVSVDHCVKTVMSFNEFSPIGRSAGDAGASHAFGRVLIKAITELDIHELLVQDLVRHMLSAKDVQGDAVNQAVDAYLGDRMTLKGLRAVATAGHSQRDAVLERANTKYTKVA